MKFLVRFFSFMFSDLDEGNLEKNFSKLKNDDLTNFTYTVCSLNNG